MRIFGLTLALLLLAAPAAATTLEITSGGGAFDAAGETNVALFGDGWFLSYHATASSPTRCRSRSLASARESFTSQPARTGCPCASRGS